LHNDKQQISVGFIGYPNVGKSSVINTLRQKKVCKVAPIPGETKVWQYITLFKRIFLIDCPGIVAPSPNETDEDIVLKGVVRVENLEDPAQYISALMARTKKEYIISTYGVQEWSDTEDFLERFARKYGKLHKKGEPDTATVAKMMLNDWMRGKIPFFVPPPMDDKDTTHTSDTQDKEKEAPVDVPSQKFGGLKVRDEFQEEGEDEAGSVDEEIKEDEGDGSVEEEEIASEDLDQLLQGVENGEIEAEDEEPEDNDEQEEEVEQVQDVDEGHEEIAVSSSTLKNRKKRMRKQKKKDAERRNSEGDNIEKRRPIKLTSKSKRKDNRTNEVTEEIKPNKASPKPEQKTRKRKVEEIDTEVSESEAQPTKRKKNSKKATQKSKKKADTDDDLDWEDLMDSVKQ